MSDKPLDGIELFAALQALVRLKSVESVAALSLDLLRDCQTSMRKLLPLVEAQIRADDERELAEAKARVAEIEARIGIKPALNLLPSISGLSLVDRPEPTEPSETDAGAGYGEAAVEGQTVESFRNELKDLRAHARAKRLRPQ